MSFNVSGVSLAGSQAQQASSSASAKSGSTLGKDDFLKLMVAQLRNQDPLNPVASADFVAQTAQFTSLEELQNINTTLTSLASEMGGYSHVTSASALLGKTVSYNGSSVALDGNSGASLGYTLPAAAKTVLVQVVDSSGNAVRTLKIGEQGAGAHQVQFDGKADDGTKLPAGSYTYQVAALDSAGNVLSGPYTGMGSVAGIRNDGGTLVLQVGTQNVPLGYVVGVMAGSGT